MTNNGEQKLGLKPELEKLVQMLLQGKIDAVDRFFSDTPVTLTPEALLAYSSERERISKVWQDEKHGEVIKKYNAAIKGMVGKKGNWLNWVSEKVREEYGPEPDMPEKLPCVVEGIPSEITLMVRRGGIVLEERARNLSNERGALHVPVPFDFAVKNKGVPGIRAYNYLVFWMGKVPFFIYNDDISFSVGPFAVMAYPQYLRASQEKGESVKVAGEFLAGVFANTFRVDYKETLNAMGLAIKRVPYL